MDDLFMLLSHNYQTDNATYSKKLTEKIQNRKTEKFWNCCC